MKNSNILRFNVGILLCGRIREYLEARRFAGMSIEWREGRGWLSREWIVKGGADDLTQINRDLSAWAKSLSD